MEFPKKFIFEKILPKIQNEEIKNKWKTNTNYLLPDNNLGYKSEDEYLEINNISKETVVLNSLKMIKNKFTQENIDYLCEQFKIFSQENKIRIITIRKRSFPIYKEIIDAMGYILKIKKMLDTYPKYYQNMFGTKYRSSNLDKVVKAQINLLQDRLDSPFFKLTSKKEIKKTEFQIKFLKRSLE